MKARAMKRVHRHLSPAEVEQLRDSLAASIPDARQDLGPLIRAMRLATRKSQSEYARLCGVTPRVLAQIEAGGYRVQVETLEKLLRPFGYRIGVVSLRYNHPSAP